MKLQLSPAWYEREIENEEHLHVTAGSSRIDPLLEEARIHHTAITPQSGTTLAPSGDSSISSVVSKE